MTLEFEAITYLQKLWHIMGRICSETLNVLHNFFIPQLKSIEVTRVGSQYKCQYDKAKTPYQRLMESEHLSLYQKQELRTGFESLNPITLRKELNDSMKWFERVFEGKSDFKYKFSA